MMKLASFLIVLAMASECNQSEKANNNGIKLEKIIFHTTECFGKCPTHHLELKADKSFKLFAEKIYKEDAMPLSQDYDSTQMGYFIGQASDSSFNKLTQELSTIGLDTLTFQGPIFSDGPTITMIVYYNGKRRYFKSASPTFRVNKILASLYEVCESKQKQRTTNKFEVESKE